MRNPLALIAAFLLLATTLPAQLTTFDWPANAAVALSDKYEVYVKMGTNAEQKLEVLMSNAIYDGDYASVVPELKGRTFSFANVGYDPVAGPGLTFRIVKKFGGAASSVSISPKSYRIVPTLSNGLEAKFSIDENNKYISIDFNAADNRTDANSWIKHMICIFIDPPESGKPSKTGSGVVVYSSTATASTLANATTIYFPKGYHNLRNYSNGAPISDGILTLKSGQSVYLEGGAYVHGLIRRTDYSDTNQRIYGRGVLSGRLHKWFKTPGYTGPEYPQLVQLGGSASANAKVEGVTMMESPSHGIVAGKTLVKNLKFLGWHSNNDAVRVGEVSEISHSFLRAVDDHFYNFNIWVHHCVLWAGHNGAILTYGWGGDQKKDGNGNPVYDSNGNPVPANTYNAGSSLLENIDIIHPEWTGLGNNNGLVAAQIGLDFKPYGYGGSATTILQNIRIEGTIPGLINLKPRSSNDGVPNALKVYKSSIGYLGDLVLSNITVNAVSGKGRIRGQTDASLETNDATKFYVKNVEFNNVFVGSTYVSGSNKATYLDIDSATTSDIRFTTALTEGTYEIKNKNSGKAVEVLNWSKADLGNIDQYVSTGGANQQWSLVHVEGVWFKLVNVNSGKVMEVDNSTTGDKTNIQQNADKGITATNQQFKFVATGDGYYAITNRNSGKVAGVANASTGDNANIRQETDTAASSQRFSFRQSP